MEPGIKPSEGLDGKPDERYFEVHTHTLPGPGKGAPADEFSQKFQAALDAKSPHSNKIAFGNRLYSQVEHHQDNESNHDSVAGQFADTYILFQRR